MQLSTLLCSIGLVQAVYRHTTIQCSYSNIVHIHIWHASYTMTIQGTLRMSIFGPQQQHE